MCDRAAESFSSHSASASSSRHAGASSRYPRRQLGRVLRPGEPLPPSQDGNNNHHSDSSDLHAGYPSPREAYRRQKAERHAADAAAAAAQPDVAGSYFTPLPRQYGFYDGLDEHTLGIPQPSREERREQLRAALESQAAAVVEFTEGGEADIEMNGLPAEQYHGQSGWTTIPKESALYQTLWKHGELESRQRTNSWGVAMRHGRGSGGGGLGDLLGESAVHHCSETAAPEAEKGAAAHESENVEEEEEVLDDRRRRRQHDESLYSTALEGELLAPTPASVGQPRSTYALRKMFVDGLVGYQGMISRAEEAAVSEELLHLLQSPRAAYVAEEARYCVNLYEKELGIPGRDTLAFALSSCPTLQRVLYRFFFLGLIPAVPNVCQVSEMVGTFSGYPVHRHPRSIGSYVGLLNLVSTSVLHLQHKDAPWYPRLHLTPRSVFVVTEPCLSDYAMGYKQTQQPFHAFEYATRVSKDYRLEVLFATVETAQAPTLSQAVQLTEYAAAKMAGGAGGEAARAAVQLQDGSSSSSSSAGSSAMTSPNTTGGEATFSASSSSTAADPLKGSTDEWLQQVRERLHHAGKGEDGAKTIDGHALRRQLLAQHVIGSRSRDEGGAGANSEADSSLPHHTSPSSSSFPQSKSPSSAAQRRLAALKARFEFAKSLKAAKQQVDVSNSGPRLIRGHSPKDRYRGIK